MVGFILQWATLPTLLMFPILAWMYIRLALREEGDARADFGTAHEDYVAETPAFWPRGSGSQTIARNDATRPAHYSAR
jgi:protein-S-isoprenylcysteine O-methyltransferase Ste14